MGEAGLAAVSAGVTNTYGDGSNSTAGANTVRSSYAGEMKPVKKKKIMKGKVNGK